MFYHNIVKYDYPFGNLFSERKYITNSKKGHAVWTRRGKASILTLFSSG